jgi:hypothetical protein
MVSCGYEALDRAIAGRLAGSLTGPPSDERRHWTVRFIAYDPAHDGIWVEPLDEDDQPLDALIEDRSAVEASIGFDQNRYAFQTRIERRESHYWLTESLIVEAVLLGGPIELFVANRRAHPRYLVPDTGSVFTQITFPVPLRVKPWDVSAGGISFLCPRDTAVLKLRRDSIVSFTLNHRGRTISGKASVRFTRLLSDRVIKMGAQFIADSFDQASQSNLKLFLVDMSRLARPLKTT